MTGKLAVMVYNRGVKPSAVRAPAGDGRNADETADATEAAEAVRWAAWIAEEVMPVKPPFETWR